MKCPYCGFEDTKVIDSRPVEGRKRRRRECTSCHKRFTTYESVEMPMLLVVKKDGSFEPFSRVKLLNGIYNAIKKRPVDVSDVVEKIELFRPCVECIEYCKEDEECKISREKFVIDMIHFRVRNVEEAGIACLSEEFLDRRCQQE